MVAKQIWSVAGVVAAAMLASVSPVRADGPPESFYKQFGIPVLFGPANGVGATFKYYLYSPAIGAYRIGTDPNMKDLNPAQIRMMQSNMPQADPYYTGSPIPYASGAVIPFDINRARIDAGEKDAAPDSFRFPVRDVPWFSVHDGETCAQVFRQAWTFTPNAIAPEIETFAVRLPGQNGDAQSMIIGSRKRNFNVIVPSAFGQILLRHGARALISRLPEGVRIVNLTGQKSSVMLRLPDGKILSVGPGSELVASKSIQYAKATPADGIARRAQTKPFAAGDTFISIAECWMPSIVSKTGLAQALVAGEETAEKKLCRQIIKTGAAVAVMKGSDGYHSDNQPELMVHGNTEKTTGQAQGKESPTKPAASDLANKNKQPAHRNKSMTVSSRILHPWHHSSVKEQIKESEEESKNSLQ